MRIDGALTPPGFIASARMQTLVHEGDRLYILYTGPGPASRADYSRAERELRLRRDALENLAVNAVVSSYIPRVKAGEARIRPDNLDQLGSEKHSHIVMCAAATDVKVKVSAVDVRLTFRVGKLKFKFDCDLEDRSKVEALAAVLGKALP